jgi:broad specificity phosphatase PhoE
VVADVRTTDGPVLVFSHGHALRALAALWLGRPVTDGRLFILDTGTISVLGFEHAEPAVRRWNCG